MSVSLNKFKTVFIAMLTIALIATTTIITSAPAQAGKHHHGRDIILGIGGLLVEKAIEAEADADEEAYENRDDNPDFGDEDTEENEENNEDTDYDQ
ncbi:MAG: hypothetical protein ACRBBN_00230 [Methyloligellaceae bacterium]